MKNKLVYGFLFLVSTFQVNAEEPVDIFDISQYKGKIVYLDFWASWCIPCRKSFPWMNSLREKYSKDQLAIIAINLDKKRSLATEFLEKYPAKFTVTYDPKGKIAKKFAIKGMPSSIIFDAKGTPLIAHTGFFVKKMDDYEKEIEQVIQNSNIPLKNQETNAQTKN